MILLVLIGSVGSALALNRSWPTTAVPFDHPAQPVAVTIEGDAEEPSHPAAP
ncbi:hypothetical protein BFL35_08405 [Clavibacter michiganensis]|nr:hypothetical protein BFL35_08405 [Clavibacter michiganensis]